MLRYELRDDLRSMNLSVVNDNGQLPLNVPQKMGQKGDKSRGLDRAFVGLLKKLSLRSDTADDRKLFPVGLGENGWRFSPCCPGVSHNWLHADTNFVGPDDRFTHLYLFFPKLEALLPATGRPVILSVPADVFALSAMRIPNVSGVSQASLGRTTRRI